MKKLCILLAVIFQSLIAITSSAQAPQGIPYQAAARDSIGNTLNNQSISIRFSIHDSSSTGTIVYQETQLITTTSLGLFSVNIGQGTPISGSIASVNWQQGSKYLQTEMDVNGGTNYVNMGTSQLMSVPYALSSGDNQWTKFGNSIRNNNTDNIGIGALPDSSAKLEISSTDKGFLMPRMTMAQRLAIHNPADGLQVYQTDSFSGVWIYMHPNWVVQNSTKDIQLIPHTIVFSYLNNIQNFVVPNGVHSIKITAIGGAGGKGVVSWDNSSYSFSYSGWDFTLVNPSTLSGYYYNGGESGKNISGYVSVNPGDTLHIITGGKANTFNAGTQDGIATPTVATAPATGTYRYKIPYGFGGYTIISESYNYNLYTTAGASGGSSKVFLNGTNNSNLLIRASGGNGGVSYNLLTPNGIAVSPFIAGSIQNSATVTDTEIDANGRVIIEYSLPSYLVSNSSTSASSGSTTVANTNTTGLLSFTDWNTFNNKIGGNGTMNELAFFNGTNNIASSQNLKWDNSNSRLEVSSLKINSLGGGTTTQLIGVDTSGKIVATSFSPSGDNLGNHKALQTINLNNNFISNDGNKEGIKLDNNGYVGIGLDSTITNFQAALNVNSRYGAPTWIALNVGDETGPRVVSGTLNGKATIGAHNSTLTAWDDLKICPVGNLAIGDITPTAKLDINGSLRYRNGALANSFLIGDALGNATWSNNIPNINATQIGIGTSSPQRALDVRGDIAQGMWTDNIPSRRVGVMNNTLQVAGMEIENTTLGGNYSQKLHLLTHHSGSSTDRRLTIDEDGQVGIGTTNPTSKLSVAGNADIAGTLSTTGNITSPKFKVSEIWNNAQGVPATTSFTCGGGTLMLNMSSMAYQITGIPATLTIQVLIDGLVVTTLKGFASQNSSQIPLSSNFKVITGIGAGTHTIQMVPLSPTIMDINSYTSASILELPF